MWTGGETGVDFDAVLEEEEGVLRSSLSTLSRKERTRWSGRTGSEVDAGDGACGRAGLVEEVLTGSFSGVFWTACLGGRLERTGGLSCLACLVCFGVAGVLGEDTGKGADGGEGIGCFVAIPRQSEESVFGDVDFTSDFGGKGAAHRTVCAMSLGF